MKAFVFFCYFQMQMKSRLYNLAHCRVATMKCARGKKKLISYACMIKKYFRIREDVTRDCKKIL